MSEIENETRRQQLDTQKNIHRRFRISLAILTVLICSFNVHTTAIQQLKHSRNLHRVLNRQLLGHDDLDIYWFGYRTGQYLINYPIQQYYFLGQFSDFLMRFEHMMGNLQQFSFGVLDQQIFNQTKQKLTIYDKQGNYIMYPWTIQQGFTSPFTSDNMTAIKNVISQCFWMEIFVTGLSMAKSDKDIDDDVRSWDITVAVEVFSETSIFVTVILHDKMYLGLQHLPHLALGFGTLFLFYIQLRQRAQRRKFRISQKLDKKTQIKQRVNQIEATDLPDLLIAFFLIYSSLASLINLFTVRYMLILDGVTCFIGWLYILKLNTENDDYHISFLIKKSYIFVGRLFVSFGPMFIGFCLFALTVFCRYSDLFVSFHKTFISIFCVCYYNMTYEEFRTTQRTNPISTIFFTSLIMIFTVCIYSGMLVSVFCSYMWNKREKKNKKELMDSLKIQCMSCHHKYGYAEGYQASVEVTVLKRQEELAEIDDGEDTVTKYRNSLRDKIYFLSQQLLLIASQNQKIVSETDDTQNLSFQEQYARILKQDLNIISQRMRGLSEQ